MEERKNRTYLQLAIFLFTEVSAWIVVPIVLALIFGSMLDGYFSTKPIIFLSLAGFGFLITCFGIYKIIQRYFKEIKDTEEK